MKSGKTLLFAITGIALVLVSACSNPFLQESVNNRNKRNNGNTGSTTITGSGIENDPFLVSTLDDLLHVGNPEPDTKYAEWGLDKYYKQTTNIDLTDIASWTSIGSSSAPFTGSYNGNGCKILNLNITDEHLTYRGLFSYIGTAGEIKNLGIVDVNISEYRNIGGVAGRSYGTIQNCYVSGSISGDNYIGGVAGDNYGTIQNCYFSGSMGGNGGLGGVAATNSIEGESVGVVQNCYAVCDITVDQLFNSGGIVGVNTSTIQNCYAAGTISGQVDYYGGVVGRNTGTVRNCVALNESILAEVIADAGAIGRVAGYSGLHGVENNYAWEGMVIKGHSGDKAPLDEGPAGIDGEPLSAGDIKDKSWWINSGNWNTTDADAEAWDFTDTWVWDDTGVNMPRLKNCPALPWPAYLENGDEESAGNTGSGLADDPFLVKTVDDLLHVGNPESGTKYADWGLDKHYKQTVDLSLDPAPVTNWTPIGNNAINTNDPYTFTGSYDGNGYKIINLTISESGKASLGLFGSIGSHGAVENLGLVNINISGNMTGTGAVVGGTNFGTIQNCYVSGSISGYTYVGGMVSSNSGGTIENCYFTGSISGIGSNNGPVGGVAGSNDNNGAIIGVIQNCFTVCEISGEGTCGGIVGDNTAAIVRNCYTAGSISATIPVNGGVTGFPRSNGIVLNCVALNETIVAENDSYFPGTEKNGRVTGYAASGSPMDIENNYAWEGMTVKVGSGIITPVDGLDKPDGEPLSAGDIKDKSWWINSDNWKTDGGATAWDFTDTWVWDDTGINMPALKNCPALPWPAYLHN